MKNLASLAAVGLFLLAPIPAARAEHRIPAPPTRFVLDEPGVLASTAKIAAENLLIEHARTTGEQVVISIFDSLEGEDLVERTNRVFAEWKIGARAKHNGVLLALYWRDRKARIEVGYGLEPTLTDSKSNAILSEFLIPELKNGRPDRAIALAAIELLRVLESPLIASGEAGKIIRAGGFRGSYNPPGGTIHVNSLALYLFLFIIIGIISFVLYLLTSADAHFSGAGWYRPKPWEFGNPWKSRGFGRPGGGSVFRGGGGSSGGGGASGSW